VKLAEYKIKCKKGARNCTIALAFLKRADKKLDDKLFIDLENQYTREHDISSDNFLQIHCWQVFLQSITRLMGARKHRFYQTFVI